MNSTCCNSEEFNLTAKIVYSTWFGVAALATIVGNGVVLWLIARNRSLRTISNLFLGSLAAADFLVGLVIDPVYIPTRCLLYNTDTYWQTYSTVVDYLWIHTTVATTFNLCCVTLDRHIAIFYPLRYEDIVTNRRCYVLIATVWFISLLLPCSRFLAKDLTVLPTLWLSFTIITVLIPMIIIIFCSIRNLKAAAVQSRRTIVQTLQNQEAVKRRKKNLKAAKTVSIVVGLFVICWLPSLVTSFVQYFVESIILLFTVWTPVEALAFTSSAINPWVYCLRNEEFHQVLIRTFRFLGKRKSTQIRIHRSIKRSTKRDMSEHDTCNSPV
ncbi:adenosine receptor A2a-like [Oculina patagonica]